MDPPAKVLDNTRRSLQDLRRKVEDASGVGEWHSAKINSVRFKVPWEETEGVMEEVLEGKSVIVYHYDEATAGRDAGRGGRE